ncbi:mycothiol system anti-sigma-R factor [Corynebacterium sp. H128]|uniref:mycothiol system anti-sigma-R factor n=1 Tax=unclassified Corynebacterium TaxID=2624378 RepID=UPI00309CDE08
MSNEHRGCDCNCSDTYARLAELLDGDCTQSAQEELRAAIASCPHCFERLGVEEEIRELLRRSCAASAPITLRQRISISIRVQQRGSFR